MAFPPGRTLILSPTYWHSLGATPTITLGDAYNLTHYPLANLTDGLNGPVFRFSTTAAGISIPISEPVNVLGILNHNLDPDVLIEAYVDGVVLPRTFSVRYPNCWIDLRAFEAGFPDEGVTPSASVGIKVYGNSRPVNFSEIVVGGAYAFDGIIEVPFPQGMSSPSSRHETEGRQKLLEWGTGVHTRAQRLSLAMVTADDYTLLQEVTEATALFQMPALMVPVVPSSRVNDIWLTRWPARLPAVKTLGDLATIQLDLIEEATGVVV